MTTDVAIRDGEVTAVARAIDFAMTFEEMGRRVRALDKFYREVMQKGTDFDTLPGTPKPTLLKPGAEMLCGVFGLAPEYIIDRATSHEDWETGFFHLQVKCRLIHRTSGMLAAEGVGSCNSKEPKYRYRWVKDNRGQRQKVENTEPWELHNTILKMAEKRAFVAATLNATGASRIFTQDVEDLATTTESESRRKTESPQPDESVERPRDGIKGGTCTECGEAIDPQAVYVVKGHDVPGEQLIRVGMQRCGQVRCGLHLPEKQAAKAAD